jgi:heme A synthase
VVRVSLVMQLAALVFLASLAAFAAVVILANRILAALRAQLGPDRMLPPGSVSCAGTILLYLLVRCAPVLEGP